MSFINKMSDAAAPVDAPVPVPAPAPTPVEAIAPVVAAVIVDFADKSVLLKFVLKTIAEVEILADRSDEDKAKFVVEEVKKAIRESSLSEDKKSELAIWCDVSLPFVVDAVKLAKSEVGNVALANVRKCCPASAPKKVEAVPAKKCCPSFLSHFFH